MGQNVLEDLEKKDPIDILLTLVDSSSGFIALLVKDKPNTHITDLIMSLLCKALTGPSRPCNRNTLMNQLRNSNFFATIAPNYITNITLNRSTNNQAQLQQSLHNLVEIVKQLLLVMPNSLVNVFPTIAMINYAVDKNILSIPDEILRQKVIELQTIQNNLQKHTSEEEQCARTNYDQNEPPPDDYKLLPIFPSLRDIHPDDKPFLRANKAKGCFDDLNHYLDVQFRLLREDFIKPLRDGVTEYLKSVSRGRPSKKLSNIRLYYQVRFVNPVCTQTGIAYRLKFDVSRLGHVSWQHSKRLIYGSLVCLSSDNFQNMVFGTVCDRDSKNLGEGEVIIHVEQAVINPSQISAEETFIMAETSAYFEAYRYVLRGLQTIRETFPFQTYLVECTNDTNPPRYFTQPQNNVCFDLTCLLDTDSNKRDIPDLMAIAESVPLLDLKAWPDAASLGFDSSQFRALHAALTREFAMIQGPPGTGKTFLGLKIVQTLLNNKQHWCAGDDQKPILVVCYTNHALDQFIEGITTFHQDGIVRVGGRSRSELLQKYNLRNLKMGLRIRREVQKEIHFSRLDAIRKMETLEEEISKVAKLIEKSEKGIVREEILLDFMTREQHESLFRADIDEESSLLNWLGLTSIQYSNDSENDVPDEMIQLTDEDENDVIAHERMLDEVDEDDLDIFRIHNKKAAEDDDNSIISFDTISLAESNNYQGNEEWQVQPQQKRRLKQLIKRRLDQGECFPEDLAKTLHDVWLLPLDDRWKLYNFWLLEYKRSLKENVKQHEDDFDQTAKRLHEVAREEDGTIMRGATILGMTTTGAAKYQQILNDIGPRIVIIEEAAEVLEAHIITTLSEGCDHVILIGDHQQLRPSPTVFELAEKFKLKISLFERMINNKVPCEILENQHRMRPSISRLLRHIYPTLRDDVTVQEYDSVRGVGSNIFFLNHNYPENLIEDTMSHYNEHEAKLIVGFCKYLLLQGYDQKQITMLTTYSGQLYKIKQLMNQEQMMFDGVRATAVDNYQGEENDIILLSLVRSNEDGAIGFLKEDNRVCVCLSRAKIGLYVIGNFDHLGTGSKLWREIIHSLEKTESIGYELQLYCENHSDEESIRVTRASDFRKAPEGGCLRPCSFRLNCGHACERVCHSYDQSHSDYICPKTCAKILCENGHICPKKCVDKCEPCKIPMKKLLPQCQHPNLVPCGMNPEKFSCTQPCDFILPCGHNCTNKCGDSHCYVCPVVETRTLACGHAVKIKCFEKNQLKTCPMPCSTNLECGHVCRGTCGTCLQKRLHEACQENCGRTLVCGHQCKEPCTKDCPPCRLPCFNRCHHSKCPRECGEPCEVCNEQCAWACEHYTCTMLCHQPCNRPHCDRPCKRTLRRCGHRCIGLCGEKCPNKCRICHKEEVEEIFFGTEDDEDARFVQLEDCGHIFEVAGLDQWMQRTDNENRDIQLKGCPRCRSPIRRNLRYGEIINEILRDIEKVKRNVIGDRTQILSESKDILAKLKEETDLPCHLTKRILKNNLTMSEVHCVVNTMTFAKHLKRIMEKGRNRTSQASSSLTTRINDIIIEADGLRTWVLEERPRFSKQQLVELRFEISRLDVVMQLFRIEREIDQKRIDLPDAPMKCLREARIISEGKTPFNENLEVKTKALLEMVKSNIPALGLDLTEPERIMIVEAMGMPKGHWFKCPKGW